MKPLTPEQVKDIIYNNIEKQPLQNQFLVNINDITKDLNDLLFTGYTVARSSLRENEEVIFSLKGKRDWPPEQAKTLNRMYSKTPDETGRDLPCKVLCMTTAHELGNQDREFYDVIFDDGDMLFNISGHHLVPNEPIPEVQENIQGSLPDGSKVHFSFMNMEDEFAEHVEQYFVDDREYFEGAEAEIISLVTYTELGDRDFEYYHIRFENGYELDDISGYHLTPMEDASTE